MISKNKKLFLKIYILFVIIISVALIILQILGSKNRVGYLTDFNLNIERMLNLYDLENITTNFLIGNKSDEEKLSNYLLTNENITNYIYHFRIRYYDKTFRNNDIYGVYPDLSNLPDYIKNVEMDGDGSPYGNLVADKIVREYKIDNINYFLKIKHKLIINYIIVIIFILLVFFVIRYNKDISCIQTIQKLKLDKYKNIIGNAFKFCSFVITIFAILIMSFSILGNIKRYGYLSELVLIQNSKKSNHYLYNFRINYSDSFFNNNNILYKVNHYISNLPDNITELKIKDYKNSYGELVSKNIIDTDKIENIIYTLDLNSSIFYTLAIMIYILIFLYMLKNINNKYFVFISITFLISISLFLFQYCICFPGAAEGDTWSLHYSGVDGNNISNWHPAFISIMLHLFFKLFGYHTFYMFLIILAFWYIGISIIIISLFLKFKKEAVLWLFLLCFLPNIFYMNMWKLKDTLAVSFLWIASALMFFTTLIKIKSNKLYIMLNILSILLLICAMLSRHNFIVTVYPIFLVFAYRILKNRNIIDNKKYIAKFLCIMILFAICLLGIYKLFPKLPIIIPRSAERVSFAVYEYQIKNLALLGNDVSLIPQEWYLKDDKGNYVISINGYYGSKSNLEISQLLNYVFNYDKMLELGNVKNTLIKYILKYPISYIKFTLKCSLKLYILTLEGGDILLHITSSDYFTYYYASDWIAEDPKINLFMDKGYENSIRHKIFISLFKYNIFFIDINMIIFVILSLILFLIPIIICILKPRIFNELLLLTFAFSFSAFATAIIVGIFTPAQEYRYIYPVCPISILSLISFITFIYDRGGFKKFFKELRGE